MIIDALQVTAGSWDDTGNIRGRIRHPAAPRHQRPIYFDKKIAEGTTPKEAIRALKRRISDAVHKSLITDAARPAAN